MVRPTLCLKLGQWWHWLLTHKCVTRSRWIMQDRYKPASSVRSVDWSIWVNELILNCDNSQENTGCVHYYYGVHDLLARPFYWNCQWKVYFDKYVWQKSSDRLIWNKAIDFIKSNFRDTKCIKTCLKFYNQSTCREHTGVGLSESLRDGLLSNSTPGHYPTQLHQYGIETLHAHAHM